MEDIREVLETMYNILDDIGEKSNLNEKLADAGVKASAILKVDIVHFLAYLAASDGVISWNEARYIGNLIGASMTPDKLNELIVENDLYSEEFEETVPMTLQMMVKVDNAVYESSAHVDIEAGEAVLTTYLLVGRGLVESNGVTVDTMDPDMKSDFENYLGMMKHYIDENTEKHHTDIICDYGKKKKTDGVKAPRKNDEPVEFVANKGSVKAPRKRA